ncbi:unnamed protein product [Staurois parvus]|uniref:Reverse transcriptase n=1 Tax=Staurois parvus TaxID=386267 RepID=A0ABN9GL91_9NEOB|nr:unnamed protein product [Staurois parvus]
MPRRLAPRSTRTNVKFSGWVERVRASRSRTPSRVPQPSIKILGINFGHADYGKLNWEAKLSDAEVKVRCWKGWRLSLRKRVDLIKTFLIPVFLYVSYICLLPESLYTRVYSCFFQMLWGNRLNLVKRNVTYSSRREGWPRYGQPGSFFLSDVLET